MAITGSVASGLEGLQNVRGLKPADATGENLQNDVQEVRLAVDRFGLTGPIEQARTRNEDLSNLEVEQLPPPTDSSRGTQVDLLA